MNVVLRVIILFICVFTFINALIFAVLAVLRSFHAYAIIWSGDSEGRPGIHLAEALDGFLLAIVFIIFAIGIGKLFVPEIRILKNIKIDWLEPKSFSELKAVLWEATLTALVVLFASMAVQKMDTLSWEALVIPASILLIAVALKMLKSTHK